MKIVEILCNVCQQQIDTKKLYFMAERKEEIFKMGDSPEGCPDCPDKNLKKGSKMKTTQVGETCYCYHFCSIEHLWKWHGRNR